MWLFGMSGYKSPWISAWINMARRVSAPGTHIANFGAELFLPAWVRCTVLICYRDFHSMSLASPQSAALAELKAFCDSLSFPTTAHDVSAFMALFRCLETDLSMVERSEVEQLVQRYFNQASWASV
jgi:hypothetical protein